VLSSFGTSTARAVIGKRWSSGAGHTILSESIETAEWIRVQTITSNDRLFAFDNSYSRLPERLFARVSPAPAPAPRLLQLNRPLAEELGLDPEQLVGNEGLEILSGNRIAPGSDPIAMAYAGHQFGNWVPQLGDGRAILIGEVVDRDGRRRDIQLKGAGRTPFSRGGDGKAPLGPVLREFIVSEAMAALGIPTTRSLAAVATGERVYRETAHAGAVLTRVAASHLRIGTFQFFYARKDTEALQALTGHAIARHAPEAAASDTPALALLEGGRAGRAGGAMDGRGLHPWRDEHRQHDDLGRDHRLWALRLPRCLSPADGVLLHRPLRALRLRNQPQIAVWNLAQLATALLPLMPDRDRATVIFSTNPGPSRPGPSAGRPASRTTRCRRPNAGPPCAPRTLS
jgi:hypothetical protein